MTDVFKDAKRFEHPEIFILGGQPGAGKSTSINYLVSSGEAKDCLIINAPTNDFSKDTASAIIKYLQNGGNGIILSNYQEGDKKMPNFNSVLEAYGVAIEKGILYEGDSNYTSGNSPTYIWCGGVKITIENIRIFVSWQWL